MPTGSSSPDRITRALAGAEVHESGPALRELAECVLVHMDAMTTEELGDLTDINEFICDLELDVGLNTADMLRLMADTPALWDFVPCPPAEIALRRVEGTSFDRELVGVMTHWMLHSLVEWFVRDELERRGLHPLVGKHEPAVEPIPARPTYRMTARPARPARMDAATAASEAKENRATAALARAGVVTQESGLIDLATMVLRHHDKSPELEDPEALADHIYERELHLHDSINVCVLVAESAELYEATCPAAARAMEDGDADSPAALAWQTIYELVVDLIRTELEHRGTVADPLAA